VPTTSGIDLPRPAIIAALAVLVLAITFLVTKAGDSVSIPTPAQPAATTTTSAGSTTTSGTTATTTPAKPAKPAKPKQPALVAGSGLPTRVARALNAHKVVVLFFYEPAASDDQATRAAIRAAKGAGVNVALFQDTVSRISAYRRIVGGLGVSQSPAMIVVDRNRKAQLLQGYLDSGTIRQTVRDAA
jgi:cytoskeletal protein RodZ